jgi:hypothetical protein
LLERGNEGILRELLGSREIADDASKTADEPGRLDPPDRLDRAVRLGGPGLAATRILGGVCLTRIYGDCHMPSVSTI